MSTGAQLAPTQTAKMEQKFYLVSIDALAPSASNPRKRIPEDELRELAESIATSGVLQPLTVRPLTETTYEIVIGERRWRAAKLANLEHVPCLVRMMTDTAVLEAQIVENLQRRDIAPLEEAASYQALLKATNDSATAKVGVADIGARIGKSPRYVYDRLDLLKLTPFARAALDDVKISPGHAVEIARLDPKQQDDVVRVTARAELSVKALREYIRQARGGSESERHAANGRAGAAVRAASRTSANPRAIPTAASLDASYSSDVIPSGKIHAPFAIGEELWCCVASEGRGDGVSAVKLKAYRAVPRSEFSGRTVDYNGKCLKGEKSRRDPKGFYHGVSVTCGGHKFVLCGPPKIFARDPAERGTIEAAKARAMRPLIEVAVRKALNPTNLRLTQLSPRERGGWLAIIVEAKALRTAAKQRRLAHGKRRSR